MWQICSTAPTVEETELQRAIVRAMSLFNKEEFDEFNATMEASIGDTLGISADASEVDMHGFTALDLPYVSVLYC